MTIRPHSTKKADKAHFVKTFKGAAFLSFMFYRRFSHHLFYSEIYLMSKNKNTANMKNNLIYGGMLFSIIGMLFFDDILVLKYIFLISAIILIVIGLRIKSEETN